MAISNYIPDNSCRYTRSKLKNVVYLLSEFHSKIIEVDGAESFVAEISAPMRISCRNVQFNEKESLDERYKFEKELKFTVNGFADINTLSGGCYAIIMTEDGTPYMTNVDFPSKITTNYTLGAKQNSTEFTFLSKSNYPTLPVKGGIYEEVTECKTYTEYGVDSLELVEREYVAASEDSNSIVLFGDKTFHPVKFVKNSLTLTERYDGEVVTDTITFDILLDDYKSSWQYNLLEFSDNIYAALVKPKNDDNQFAVGFNLGLAPSYEINTSATEGESNRVTITLTEKSPHGMFTMQNPTISRDQGSTWRYITSIFGQDTYECVDNCVAKYLVKQEYDSNSTPRNRFKVLNGYEDRFSFLNIVGTFNERMTFYTTQCSWFSKCTLITNMPDILQFVGNSREYRYYNFYCSCPWEIQNKPDYIEFTQTSGNGGIEISLGVRNMLLPEETTIGSFTLVYGNNYAGYEIEVNTADWKMVATYNGEEPYGVVCSENQSLTEADVTDSGARPKTNMVQAVLGECVDSIGNNAFSGCTNLTSIEMPDGNIVTIGNNAFKGCSLTDITIPNSVEFIGGSAYQGCGNAVSLNLGEDLDTIGESAFRDCSNLIYAEIPSEVRIIGSNAFQGCTRLEEVNILSDVLYEIPNACFRDCLSLGSFTVPSGVTSIGTYAFYNCGELREVLLPLSLTRIGDYAFINCSNLSSINFNDGLEEIGARAFSDCSSLTNIYIPSTVTDISSLAFYNCSRLRGITIEATTPPTLGTDPFRNTNNCPIYVPCSSWALYQADETWYQYADRMQPIETNCPMKCTLRTPVRGFVLPCNDSNNLTKEEIDTTNLRTTVTEAIIHDNCCTKISWRAFSGCTSLSSVTIPDTVTSIDDYAFQGCYNLSNLTIGSGVTSIGYLGFAGCSRLDNITLPQSLTTIGHFTFDSCTSLKSINIPCSTNDYSFQNCTSLTSVTIDSGVTSIGSSTFSGCYSLSSITIPNNVTAIYSNAFQGCSSLESIYIPNSVTTLGVGAFLNCTGLDSVVIGSGVTSIGSSTFSDCSNLTSVSMYSGITSIGRYAFENCVSLENIGLPSRLTTINNNAFIGCYGLLSMTIPSGVTSIGIDVFKGCSSLEYVRMTSLTPPTLGSGAFDDTSCLIYVPCEALSTYLTASGWSNYRDRIYGEQQSPIMCNQKIKLGFTDETNFTWYCDDTAYVDSGQTADLCRRKQKSKSDIKTVQIKDCVTSIGDKAFDTCQNLESVTLPNTLRSIGDGAFQVCTSLSSCTIPSGVTSIGSYAFYHCLALESANIPDSVSTISLHTFRGCTSLSSVTVGSGVTRIEGCAFSGCTNLSSINIPSGVTYIGQEAFAYCSSLTSITLPSTITSLGNKVFYECRGLQSLTIEALTPPSNVNEYTFNNAVGTYYYIYVPCGVLNDYYTAWPWYRSRLRPMDSCGFKYEMLKLNGGYVTRYCDNGNTISSAETHNYVTPSEVRSITIKDCAKTIDKDYVFSSPTDASQRFTNMSSVTMNSDSVQQMLNPSYAFMGCTSLERVRLSNALSNVGSYAFSGCSSLSSVTSGNNITSIDDGAFYDCYNLLSFTTPSGLTLIGADAFNGCTGLTTFTMPNTVTSIGDAAFKRCFNLTAITLSNNLTYLGEGAFERCRELRSVNIPSGVTSIGDATFSGCSQLSSLTIGNSVTSIGVEAFRECNRLTAVTIPNSVTSIDNGAFFGSMRLRTVTMSENITSLSERCFAKCSSLRTINIPSGVTSFGYGAFSGCSSLSGVTIPSGVTEIGDRCFERCYSLSSVTIPSVESIGNYAFSGCVGLTGITMMSESVPTIGEGVFENTNNCPIYVPCLSGYLNNPSWLEYRNRLVEYGGGCTPALAATYSDSSQYNVYCMDLESNVLTKEIVRAHTTSYTEMLTASVGGCITNIDGAFEGCTKLTTVTLGDNITTI